VDEANQNYRKAMDAVQQLVRGFKSVGSGGLDENVQRLLTQPIVGAQAFMKGADPAAPANRGLQTLCSKLAPLLHKYPFINGTDKDVSLQELTALFGPAGAIAGFRDASLAELVVKDGGRWKVKDPAKKPQITQEMLAFLNQAQRIADGLFADGSPTPNLSYNLRPKLVSDYKGLNVEVKIDGKTEVWKEGQQLQKTFHWPAKDLSLAGADGRLTNSSGNPMVAFGSQGGVWGIFRLMAEADPRPAEQDWVEWSRVRSGNGREQKITPVRLDIPGQGDARVFDPKLFLNVHCPRKAGE
jgi:type VI secretion system protein ImpL